jgi:glycogen operon protein
LAHPAIIGYLQRLGVTAVELMPVHQFVHVRRTLREVCCGMQPTASLSRAWRWSDARGAGDGSSRIG